MVGRRALDCEENTIMSKRNETPKETMTLNNQGTELARSEAPSELLRELVAHLRQNRTQLREEWVVRITETRLLTAMTKEEIFAEATSVYDSYVEALETEAFEALQAYARNLSERIIPRGVETHEVVGIVLLLRDVLARSLFAKYQNDFKKLNRTLDAYEPAANRIANTVAVGFVQERERVTWRGAGSRAVLLPGEVQIGRRGYSAGLHRILLPLGSENSDLQCSLPEPRILPGDLTHFRGATAGRIVPFRLAE